MIVDGIHMRISMELEMMLAVIVEGRQIETIQKKRMMIAGYVKNVDETVSQSSLIVSPHYILVFQRGGDTSHDEDSQNTVGSEDGEGGSRPLLEDDGLEDDDDVSSIKINVLEILL